jgi:putative restriction endonuclease
MNDEFDFPLFKRLARNDTGQARGHQAGVVIPTALDEFFPQLVEMNGGATHTPSRQISVEMFVGAEFIGSVDTRYQYQTWGGTRAPERRITGNLPLLREYAGPDDVLLIERSLNDPDHYRFRLLKKETEAFDSVIQLIGDRRWGVLDERPSSEVEAIAQLGNIQLTENEAFKLIETDAPIVESRSIRIARSRAFKIHLADLYERRCAMCGFACTDEHGQNETEAAHIVPRSQRGADDARNGVLLCRSHHWAFDAGLIGIDQSRTIRVRPSLLGDVKNRVLNEVSNQPIRRPLVENLQPHLLALQWHFEKIAVLH